MLSPNTQIADRVKEALRNDPRTKQEIIDLAFNQGTLSMRGVVKSEEIRRAAEEIARADPDVINVQSEILVG